MSSTVLPTYKVTIAPASTQMVVFYPEGLTFTLCTVLSLPYTLLHAELSAVFTADKVHLPSSRREVGLSGRRRSTYYF